MTTLQSRVFDEGYEAAKAGGSYSDCPYGGMAAVLWHNGHTSRMTEEEVTQIVKEKNGGNE